MAVVRSKPALLSTRTERGQLGLPAPTAILTALTVDAILVAGAADLAPLALIVSIRLAQNVSCALDIRHFRSSGLFDGEKYLENAVS